MGAPRHKFDPQIKDLSTIFVDGEWQLATGNRWHTLVDPDTELNTGGLLASDVTTVNRAVSAAKSAFDGWSRSTVADRRALLQALIDTIAARHDQFALTISQEIGAPIDFARNAQVSAALAHLRTTVDALTASRDDAPLADDPLHRARHEPIGVAALITPWNWPLNQVVLKVGAALAAGCTVVLKPSEYATRTALLLANAVQTAGAPPGVFNLVTGDGRTGADLAAHGDVDIVSFTGSTRAGRHVAAAAARRFAHSTLELGGKSPNLLFDDCDLEVAIQQGLAHCFRNSGQSCNAASRMLVAKPIYEKAVALAGELASATALGRPINPGGHLGPLVNRPQFERVQRYIRDGIEAGTRLIAGGLGRAPGFAQGFYCSPTVFANVEPQNPLFQEEIFGPVLTIAPFADEDEAISLANATEYGLAAYVQTADPVRADRVARRLRVGMVQINGISRAPGAPFGGIKASGAGREAGLWGIRAFQDIKSISGTALCEDVI